MRSHQTFHYELSNLPIPIGMGKVLQRIESNLVGLNLVVMTTNNDMSHNT